MKFICDMRIQIPTDLLSRLIPECTKVYLRWMTAVFVFRQAKEGIH